MPSKSEVHTQQYSRYTKPKPHEHRAPCKPSYALPAMGWISPLQPVFCFPSPSGTLGCNAFLVNARRGLLPAQWQMWHTPALQPLQSNDDLLGAPPKETPRTPRSARTTGLVSLSKFLQGLPLNNDTKTVCSTLSTRTKVVTPPPWEERRCKTGMFNTNHQAGNNIQGTLTWGENRGPTEYLYFLEVLPFTLFLLFLPI